MMREADVFRWWCRSRDGARARPVSRKTPRRVAAWSLAAVVMASGVAAAGAEEAPPTRRELEEALATAREAKEQAAALQQRMDQQGVQATFRDGVVFQDARGLWNVRLLGRAQLDYRRYLGADEANADTFSVRRARVGAQVTLFRDYLVQIEGEFAGASAAMTLGFLEAGWFPSARIRMGQFKPQFGLEQTLLDLQSDFQERALTQNLLDGNGINYDRGIMVHGQPWAPVYYALTVSNGTGTGVDDQGRTAAEARADGKDVTVRGVVDFARWAGLQDTVLHAGLSWKGGRQANRQTVGADGRSEAFAAPSFRSEARGLAFFTPVSFAATAGTPPPTVGDIDRRLDAVEVSTAWRSLRLTGESWRGRYAGHATPAAGAAVDFDREIRASYVSLLWLATGEVWSDYYANGFWQKVRPNNNFSLEPGGGWGAWELGVRYSTMDATDFRARTANPEGTGRLRAGFTNKAEAWTFQVKWMHNPYSRWLLSYVQTRFDSPVAVNGLQVDREDAVLLRAQVDF